MHVCFIGQALTTKEILYVIILAGACFSFVWLGLKIRIKKEKSPHSGFNQLLCNQLCDCNYLM